MMVQRSHLLLIFIIQHKDFLNRLLKNLCHFQRQHRRRHELAALNGIYCLTADANGLGQLLLRHAHLGTRNHNPVLHP